MCNLVIPNINYLTHLKLFSIMRAGICMSCECYHCITIIILIPLILNMISENLGCV